MNGDDQLGQTSHTDTCATARSLNSSGPQARWDYATFLSAGASEKIGKPYTDMGNGLYPFRRSIPVGRVG
jgi:hypothetical protein